MTVIAVLVKKCT